MEQRIKELQHIHTYTPHTQTNDTHPDGLPSVCMLAGFKRNLSSPFFFFLTKESVQSAQLSTCRFLLLMSQLIPNCAHSSQPQYSLLLLSFASLFPSSGGRSSLLLSRLFPWLTPRLLRVSFSLTSVFFFSVHITARDVFGSSRVFPLIRYYCPDPLPHATTDTSPWLIT